MFLKQRVEMYPGPFSVGPRKIIGVICADGEQRNAYCSDRGADTFFSIPAYVHVKSKKVYGYVTKETLCGFTTETSNDPAVWKFVAYHYGDNDRPYKYGHLLPAGAYVAWINQKENANV